MFSGNLTFKNLNHLVNRSSTILKEAKFGSPVFIIHSNFPRQKFKQESVDSTAQMEYKLPICQKQLSAIFKLFATEIQTKICRTADGSFQKQPARFSNVPRQKFKQQSDCRFDGICQKQPARFSISRANKSSLLKQHDCVHFSQDKCTFLFTFC